MKDEVTVLSLGAGVQSSALLLMSDRGYEGEADGNPYVVPRADFAVFADTQSEPREVYSWLWFLEETVSIPIVTTSKGNLHEDSIRGKERFASVPSFVRNPDGSQGINRRQCTKEYKLEPVYRAIRERLGYRPGQRMMHKVRVLIGISCDEAHRRKGPMHAWVENVYPLVDMWKSRDWAKKYVMGTVNREPPRSACWMCPFHSNSEWRALRDNDPRSWEKAIEFDREMRRQAKFDGENFLHRSMVPLDKADIEDASKDQISLFGNECEGMCGV